MGLRDGGGGRGSGLQGANCGVLQSASEGHVQRSAPQAPVPHTSSQQVGDQQRGGAGQVAGQPEARWVRWGARRRAISNGGNACKRLAGAGPAGGRFGAAAARGGRRRKAFARHIPALAPPGDLPHGPAALHAQGGRGEQRVRVPAGAGQQAALRAAKLRGQRPGHAHPARVSSAAGCHRRPWSRAGVRAAATGPAAAGRAPAGQQRRPCRAQGRGWQLPARGPSSWNSSRLALNVLGLLRVPRRQIKQCAAASRAGLMAGGGGAVPPHSGAAAS